MHRNPTLLRSLLAAAVFAITATGARPPRLSEDRELNEVNLTGWDCLNRLEGTAKTADGVERNRLKNRSTPDLAGARIASLDTAAFLKGLAAFDAQTKGKRRKDLSPAQKTELDQREKQLVSLTGYLVLAYAGPPESTNCGNVDFHDWHLEVFAAPADHAPEVGDPTPIICEITPRTQNAVYRDHIRLKALAAFIRAPDLSYEPTQHPARKIRLTGYLLWDDDHNGAADVGATIRSIGANKYHNPWRSTAWEIHPVVRVEMLDAPASPEEGGAQTPPAAAATTTPVAAPATPAPQFATLVAPVKIKIPYGETILPRGTRLPVVTRNGATVTVQYLGQTQIIPLASTDLR
ncbi:MAG: hypothetical protein ACR2MW_06325 [Chthoniobacterales bacterium]